MKEFGLYTLLRFAVFGATLAIVAGLWALVTSDGIPWLPVVVVSAIISMIISVPLLNRQRQEFAARIETRANAALEKARAAEDEDGSPA